MHYLVSEQVLRQLVELAPAGVALTLPSGKVVLSNAELERMFGYSRAELLDSQIDRLIPERFRIGHAVLRAAKIEQFGSSAMGSGRELVGVRADATEFPIEVGIGSLHGPDGALVVEIIVDISVRRRLERMFQKIVEAAPCALIVVDGSGRIMLANSFVEEMFGYARAELIGNPVEVLLPERLRTGHDQHRRAFTVAPAIRQIGVGRDLTARRKDGSEFPVEIGLNPVAGPEGGLVLAAVTDITQRKALQLELHQANANLEEFTSVASHDLRSPLRGISDLLEWVVEDLGAEPPANVTHNLARVRDRIHRLEHIIEDLLVYARAGATSAVVGMVDVRTLLEDIIVITPVPAGFQIRLRVDAQPFVTSKTPLETVLRNLISNALKHHDRSSGSIEVQVVDEGRYCVLSVTDDGPGIPLAAQERIFRMFQTLATEGPQHSGIGLALCKRMVEAHGGRITVTSADGIRGTSFQVRWPRFQWRNDVN
jgi:PAS domain S-box-containing protein